jgi:hypothetical protein
MRKVAVFGNAGGGKSTLARRLAEITGVTLYPLDAIQFRVGGGEVPHEEYLKTHTELVKRDQWIIDGYGTTASAWNPEGWPENSPMWSSTMSSYRVVWRCHRWLTPKYRQLVAAASSSKRVHHLKSPGEMKAFLLAVKREHQGG